MKSSPNWSVSYRKVGCTVYVSCTSGGGQQIGGGELVLGEMLPVGCRPTPPAGVSAIPGLLSGAGVNLDAARFNVEPSGRMTIYTTTETAYWNAFAVFPVDA